MSIYNQLELDRWNYFYNNMESELSCFPEEAEKIKALWALLCSKLPNKMVLPVVTRDNNDQLMMYWSFKDFVFVFNFEYGSDTIEWFSRERNAVPAEYEGGIFTKETQDFALIWLERCLDAAPDDACLLNKDSYKE